MISIKGGNEISGNIKIGGSKNASLPIIAACLLIKGKVKLINVPDIGDVHTFLEILSGIGVKFIFSNGILEIDSSNLKEADFDLEKIKKIRVSILLLAPLLYRIGKISIPTPGGCNLGKRSIEGHLEGLKNIGYNLNYKGEEIILNGNSKSGDLEINAGFGVTVSENLIVANVLRQGKTTIRFSAIEPHVINLINFLIASGANISLKYDNTIIINGVKELKSNFSFEIISDYLQSGTYMIIGALISKDFLIIENARENDLYFFIEKMKEAGVRIESLGNDTIKVYRTKKLKPVSIQTNIFPGFPTDLQSPFAVLMTQASGNSNIFEILFERRLSWLVELEKMGVSLDIINHHEAIIHGGKILKASEVTSWDLRAGAAMIIAGLIANGETKISNVEYIHRGYENIVKNLKLLGADIKDDN